MSTILTSIQAEQEASLLRIKHLIIGGVHDLLFGDTAASLPTIDLSAEEPRTQPSIKLEPGTVPITKKPGSKRSPAELRSLSDRILRYVGSNPGERLETMAVGLAVPSAELKGPLLKLRAEKRLTVKGQKRAMRYYPKKGN